MQKYTIDTLPYENIQEQDLKLSNIQVIFDLWRKLRGSIKMQERWTAVHETSKEWVARMTTLGKYNNAVQ